uniref:JAB domain-containing protein n=1 Tax=Escherichia coli TaxID=562 RepID=UPI003D2F45DC
SSRSSPAMFRISHSRAARVEVKATPSKADRLITERLVQALGLVDIRVPDHLIVGGSQVFSFAEHGLL